MLMSFPTLSRRCNTATRRTPLPERWQRENPPLNTVRILLFCNEIVNKNCLKLVILKGYRFHDVTEACRLHHGSSFLDRHSLISLPNFIDLWLDSHIDQLCTYRNRLKIRIRIHTIPVTGDYCKGGFHMFKKVVSSGWTIPVGQHLICIPTGIHGYRCR